MPAFKNGKLLLVAGPVVLLLLAVACRAGEDTGQTAAPTITVTSVPSVSSTSGSVPTASETTTIAPARTTVAGFGQVAYRVQGSTAQRCALLADTETQRERGLMNRTDLAGYDGMLFVFATNETGGFWMKDTLLPLSIAWFDANGRLVSTADMEPCLTGGNCPSYFPTGAYRYALEVQKGGLGALGIGPGSMLSIGGACT